MAQVDLLPTLMTMVACGQGISILHRDMLPRSNGRIAFVPLRSVSYFRRWLMWDINNDNPCLQPLIELGHKWQDDPAQDKMPCAGCRYYSEKERIKEDL